MRILLSFRRWSLEVRRARASILRPQRRLPFLRAEAAPEAYRTRCGGEIIMTRTDIIHDAGSKLNKRFPSLVEAYNYANGLIAAGLTMQPSRVFQDRITASRRNRFLLLLGVERK